MHYCPDEDKRVGIVEKRSSYLPSLFTFFHEIGTADHFSNIKINKYQLVYLNNSMNNLKKKTNRDSMSFLALAFDKKQDFLSLFRQNSSTWSG